MKHLTSVLFALALSLGSATGASAFDITTQGSGKLSWLTNGNACWRACFVARNNAIQEMGRVAGVQCPGGYTVTRPASCQTPGRDNSYLDHEWGWPVCKCTDTCSGSFQCTTNGQKPSFHVNVAEEWRKLRRAWRINAYDLQSSRETMSRVRNPNQLYALVKRQSIRYGVNAKPFFAAFARGEIEAVRAPDPERLASEFNPVLPILKTDTVARRIPGRGVHLTVSTFGKVRDIHVFMNGRLIRSISPKGIGYTRVMLEDECLRDAAEIEVVRGGVSESVVIQ